MSFPLKTLNPFKPPSHPLWAALWLMAVFAVIGAVGQTLLTEEPVSLPNLLLVLALLGLNALSIPRTFSHMPVEGGRNALFALYQGIWFGLFMAAFNAGPDASHYAIWLQIGLAGGIFGAMHYAFVTDHDMQQASVINPYYGDPDPAQGDYALGWACTLLGVGMGLSVLGLNIAWVLLIMTLLLNATPYGRPMIPAYDRPALRTGLRVLRALLAALAIGAILITGGSPWPNVNA